jgi:DNA-binding transcriptional regulator YhcF (GntR family)
MLETQHVTQILAPAPREHWKVVRNYLEEQIAVGEYPAGSWLPSIRELAARLTLNRNTVARAYKGLVASGLARAVVGKGLLVTSPTDGTRSRRSIGQHEVDPVHGVAGQIRSLVASAKQANVQRAALLASLNEAIEEIYSRDLCRIAFVECNDRAADEVAGDLSGHLGVSIQPWLLDDFARAHSQSGEVDIILTTRFHLEAVTHAARSTNAEIVSVGRTVSLESLLDLMQISAFQRVAVVATDASTLCDLADVVQRYGAEPAFSCLIADTASVRELTTTADVIVDTALSHETIAKMGTSLPVITVRFHAEHASLERIRAIIKRHLLAKRGPAQN